MFSYQIKFSDLEWTSPMEGVRSCEVVHEGRRLRVVIYTPQMPPHWCENGHIGYILDGEMEIEFPNTTLVFESGDGVFIPSGYDHRHRARALTERVTAVFVEDLPK